MKRAYRKSEIPLAVRSIASISTWLGGAAFFCVMLPQARAVSWEPPICGSLAENEACTTVWPWLANTRGEHQIHRYLAISATGADAEALVSTGNAIAIGNSAIAGDFMTRGQIAIGAYSLAEGLSALGVGAQSVASGVGAAALGRQSSALAASSLAVGDHSIATSSDAIAIGHGAQATAKDSVALGWVSRAYAEGVVAVGNGATIEASADHSVAIGKNARVVDSATEAVALGDGSQANRPRVVSVGSQTKLRQITHVGAGTLETDAVNMLQLKALQDRVEKLEMLIDGLGGPNARRW